MTFPGGSDGKESANNVGDPFTIPVSGRSPGEGNGYSLQYSCLENFMDTGRLQSMGSQRVRHDLVTKPPPSPYSGECRICMKYKIRVQINVVLDLNYKRSDPRNSSTFPSTCSLFATGVSTLEIMVKFWHTKQNTHTNQTTHHPPKPYPQTLRLV